MQVRRRGDVNAGVYRKPKIAHMQLQSDFLVTQREIELLGTLDRTAQEQNHLTRNGLGGVDAGGPGPGHYVEIAVLKGTVGKLRR